MELLDILTATAKTARLGPVFSGAAWSEVTAALGEPSEVGPPRRKGSRQRLFGYGDLELSVCRCGKVGLVCVQTWRDAVELPPSATGGPATCPGGLTYADVVSALDAADCPWEPFLPLTFGDQSALVATPSGARFTFETREGEHPVLNVMGLPDTSAHEAGAPRC